MSALFEKAQANELGWRDVSPNLVAGTTVRLVDVREPSEFCGELGHIPSAELVPLATLTEASQSWDKSKELVLVCRSGARSGKAASVLVAKGFTQVMNLKGGMIAWNEQGLSVEKV